MLEVIEGNEPLPRWLPPYVHGLFATAPAARLAVARTGAGTLRGHESNPTSVNNVETLGRTSRMYLRTGAAVVPVPRHAQITGHRCATVVGDAERAGVVEVVLGTTLGAVVDDVRSSPSGPFDPSRAVRCHEPGRHRRAARHAAHLRGVRAIGSGLGAAGFTVYDDTACMVDVRCSSRDSCTSSRAGSARHASSARANHEPPRTLGDRRRQRRRRTWDRALAGPGR